MLIPIIVCTIQTIKLCNSEEGFGLLEEVRGRTIHEESFEYYTPPFLDSDIYIFCLLCLAVYIGIAINIRISNVPKSQMPLKTKYAFCITTTLFYLAIISAIVYWFDSLFLFGNNYNYYYCKLGDTTEDFILAALGLYLLLLLLNLLIIVLSRCKTIVQTLLLVLGITIFVPLVFFIYLYIRIFLLK